MPTNRTRLSRARRETEIDPAVFARLTGAPCPVGANRFRYGFPDDPAGDWRAWKDMILAAWVRDHPGTRPPAWWSYDAPRQPAGRYPGWFYDGQLCEPRLRVGGKGTAAHEVLAYVPHFVLGIPASWVADWSLDYYNGRAKDVHGKPIDTEYGEGDFIAERFDPDDPPVFESQAAYLRRNGLLLEREGARLKAADFEPEALPRELWPALPVDDLHE